MDKVMELYKVVKVSDSGYCSCNRESCSNYHLGVKTVAPKGTKLFCFATIERAKVFRQFGIGFVILKGTGTNPSRPRHCCGSYDFDLFWKLLRQKKSTLSHSYSVPAGTIWVDSFTPTEVMMIGYVCFWNSVKPL